MPTLVYLAWLITHNRRAVAAGRPMLQLGDAPWPWLAGAGIALMGCMLGGLALLDGTAPGAHYTPPRVIDGIVVPGSSSR